MSFAYTRIDSLSVGKINGSNINSPCNYRISVDPTINPDPIIGGLIVNASSTQPTPLIYNMPLTLGPIELGLASPFAQDPSNCFTVTPNQITCNVSGTYQLGLNINALFTIFNPFNLLAIQLLRNGETVFTAPPIVNVGGIMQDTSSLPIGPLFPGGLFISSTSIAQLVAGDVLVVVIWLNTESVVIALTSCVTITRV